MFILLSKGNDYLWLLCPFVWFGSIHSDITFVEQKSDHLCLIPKVSMLCGNLWHLCQEVIVAFVDFSVPSHMYSFAPYSKEKNPNKVKHFPNITCFYTCCVSIYNQICYWFSFEPHYTWLNDGWQCRLISLSIALMDCQGICCMNSCPSEREFGQLSDSMIFTLSTP